ncbi:hypothetical protein HaLaN_08582 [Haematococcus lacustris]|uniref:Uncharacterized protein n=1 Tax=Haematococcus lacustris TaxID=44745 RepID=A0A699Z1C4_HAELA|nr:hypothetical protein HaLaN_08582 [Haematococcus lacustris]
MSGGSSADAVPVAIRVPGLGPAGVGSGGGHPDGAPDTRGQQTAGGTNHLPHTPQPPAAAPGSEVCGGHAGASPCAPPCGLQGRRPAS